MILVLDASAIIAMLRNEAGGKSVAQAIDLPENVCYVHATNMCEVYYGLTRERHEAFARGKVVELQEAGIAVRTDMDVEFWQFAGRIKAELARISLADCYCVTLANRLNAELVTTDHHELDAVASRNLCSVNFVR